MEIAFKITYFQMMSCTSGCERVKFTFVSHVISLFHEKNWTTHFKGRDGKGEVEGRAKRMGVRRGRMELECGFTLCLGHRSYGL